MTDQSVEEGEEEEVSKKKSSRYHFEEFPQTNLRYILNGNPSLFVFYLNQALRIFNSQCVYLVGFVYKFCHNPLIILLHRVYFIQFFI